MSAAGEGSIATEFVDFYGLKEYNVTVLVRKGTTWCAVCMISGKIFAVLFFIGKVQMSGAPASPEQAVH